MAKRSTTAAGRPVHKPIQTPEFAARRDRVLRALGGSMGVVFAGDGAPPLVGRWMPDPMFVYLTGIEDEPGAAVLFTPKHPDPRSRVALFLKPRNPEMEKWDGARDPIGETLRTRLGFTRVFRTNALPTIINRSMPYHKSMGCLHPFSAHTAPVSSDLKLFRDIASRRVGVSIDDKTAVLPKLRAVKSASEIKLMKAAIDATHEGHKRLCAKLQPGMDELELQAALEEGFIAGGAHEPGFNSIVASGFSSTVAHYRSSGAVIEDGDVLLVDCGARTHGYCADITRVFPISGRFTKRQREVYDIVLKSMRKTIAAVRPGVTLAQLDKVSRDVIEQAGYGDHYHHGVGHHLGIEVHDIDPGTSLEPGMVVTIEPGIYLPDEKIGIRLEDDIRVTKTGHQNLSKHIPVEAADVEAFVRACKR